MSGTDGNDVLSGDGGNDSLDGGSDNDNLSGMSGNDTIVAGNGEDTLSGGSGNDSLVGSSGMDTITGGWGADTITGSGGNDVFKFDYLADTNDRITDFGDGIDLIDLSGIDANAGAANNNVFVFGGENAGVLAYSVTFQRITGGFTVLADTDGMLNTVEFMITVMTTGTWGTDPLTGALNPLTAANFIL